jgi:nucleoid DNA-binding protein
MNPKNYKEFKEGIAEEVGVHQNVVDDFISFYYSRLRKNLSDLTSPRIFVDGLGTFVVRKQKLDKNIKRNKDILGNIGKQTYKGYEKSVAVKEKLDQMERLQTEYNEMLENKKNFKRDSHED